MHHLLPAETLLPRAPSLSLDRARRTLIIFWELELEKNAANVRRHIRVDKHDIASYGAAHVSGSSGKWSRVPAYLPVSNGYGARYNSATQTETTLRAASFPTSAHGLERSAHRSWNGRAYQRVVYDRSMIAYCNKWIKYIQPRSKFRIVRDVLVTIPLLLVRTSCRSLTSPDPSSDRRLFPFDKSGGS